jgi:hypothetical protein
MASRFDNIQSRSIYVGASTNVDPALGDLGIDGNLGVGTPTPISAISVYRGAGTNAYIEVSGNGNTLGSTSMLYGQDSSNQGYVWNRANAPIYFGTNGSTRMYLTAGGNLGIGTTSPGAKLHISAGDSSYALFGPNVSYGGSLRVGAGPATPSNTVAQVVASDGNLHLDSGTGQLTYINYYSETNTLINPNAGNVGIGSYNPIHKLTVGGNISISGGTGYLDFANGDIRFVNNAGLLSVQTYSIGTGLSTKMVVTGAGNVGIGTTAPDFNLTINGITGIQSSGTTKYHFAYYTGGLNFAQTGIADYRLFIQDGGNVGIGTGSPMSLLSVAGNATFGQGANRPVTYDSNGGNFRITANVGGWATGYFFNGSAGTYRGGFGAFGSNDAVDYYWIGDDYYIPTIVIKPNQGNVGIGTTNPGYKLQVETGADGSVTQFRGSSGNSTEFGFDGIGAYIETLGTSTSRQKLRIQTYNGNAYTQLLIDGGNEYIYTSSNAKVGIGTSNPGYQLEVSGWVGASRYYPYNSNNTYIAGDTAGLTIDGSGYLYAASSGGSYFQGPMRLRNALSNDTNSYLQINGGTANLTYFAGTIGVGSTSIFHSATITSAGKIFLAQTNNSDIGGTIYGYWDSGYQAYAGGLVFQSFNANGGTPYTTKDVMWLTGNGNLGVGTNDTFGNKVSINRGVSGTPAWNNATLELRAESSLTAALVFHRTGQSEASIYSDNGSLVFGEFGGERMRITGGNVGIGTSTPAAKLHVVGDMFGGSLFFSNANINSFGSAMTFTNNSAERMRISTTGNVGIGTVSPDASALLDITSRSKGFLPPRMTNSEMVAISTPAAGLVVYDTTNNKLTVYNGSTWVPLH